MLIGPVRGQNIGYICKNIKLTSFCPKKVLLSLAHTPNCYKIPNGITITMSWCSLNIYPVNYAAMAVLSVWHDQNYRKLQCPFLGLFIVKVDPLSFASRSIPLKLGLSMLCFSDKWSVLGHLNCLDNKLAMKGLIKCLGQIFWTNSAGLVILWQLVYLQVLSMKIGPEISILSFLTLFSGYALFASSFWQCPKGY